MNTTPSKTLLRSEGPDAYILALARSFPCLGSKIDMLFPPGRPWDVDAFMDASAPWSSGEKRCAAFVANVWNPGYAESQGWRFDLFDAVGTWDNRNRAAALAWIADPVWP